MALTGLLSQLHLLDRSSSTFHDQLSNILYGEEFKQQAPNLQSDGLVWLVDYMDTVRRRVSSFVPHSNNRRLSILLTPPVPLSENAYANLET